MQKYININKKDIDDIKIDINEINDKTIPEIYKYINDYLNDKINIAKSNKLEISKKSYNNRYPIKVSDVSNYNNINNKNSMGSNLFNQNSVNTDITNNSKNFIINNPSNQIDKAKNIDDMANQIELMAGGNAKINNEYNKNNVNNKINVIKENNFDKNSSNNDWREKNDESDSINRLITDVKEKKQNISKNSFDLDFDS